MEEHHETLFNYAKQLLSDLESGNSRDALNTIAELHQHRDQVLFREVGKLTRSLHESIKNFAIDTRNLAVEEEMSRMGDASQRLNFVIEKTEAAAHATLDHVDHIMPISSKLGNDARNIKDEWDRLMRKELSAEEFRGLSKSVGAFLTQAVEDSTAIETDLTKILMAQGYQDITGQVIKKVIDLVKEVEESLVQLVSMAGAIDQITGTVHEDLPDIEAAKSEDNSSKGDGPTIDPSNRDDVVSGQDDVDALLSSLGF